MEAAGDAVQASVLVVNYNAGEDLRACLAGLAAQTASDFEVLLIDNASQDGSCEDLGDFPWPFRFLPQSENLGFAAANNLGARAARAPLIALLNPDAVPEPDWLERLLQAAARHPEVVMFGSLQVDLANAGLLDGAGDVMHAAGVMYRGGYGSSIDRAPATGETFAPCAAAALYRRDAFLGAGGFDETFFCYCEDVDLAYRLRLMGHRCLQVSEARVRHRGSGTTSKRSPFALYHGARNRLWTYVKNTPLPLLALTAPAHVAIVLVLLALAVPAGEAGPLLRGLRDGAAGLPGALRARRATQRSRRASVAQIARALTWSPAKLAKREADVRPL